MSFLYNILKNGLSIGIMKVLDRMAPTKSKADQAGEDAADVRQALDGLNFACQLIMVFVHLYRLISSISALRNLLFFIFSWYSAHVDCVRYFLYSSILVTFLYFLIILCLSCKFIPKPIIFYTICFLMFFFYVMYFYILICLIALISYVIFSTALVCYHCYKLFSHCKKLFPVNANDVGRQKSGCLATSLNRWARSTVAGAYKAIIDALLYEAT